MDNSIGIIFGLIIVILLCFVVAELFGRSKHIGRWWSFLLLIGGLIPGIIALIVSPSAKKKPTKAKSSYKIWAIVCFILGIINLFQLVVSDGQLGQPFFVFFILGLYLYDLSQGLIINKTPKYYFSINTNRFSDARVNTKKTQKDNLTTSEQTQSINEKLETLKELHKKAILTDSEYYEKSAILKTQKLQIELKQTDEYKKLKSLYDDGILTKEEFESKVKNLSVKRDSKENTYNSGFNFRITDSLKEGYYLITDNELSYGFVDSGYNIVIKPKYEYAESFNEGLALVRLNRKFGFIDQKGRVVIDLIYDNAESFKNGVSKVTFGNEKFKINTKGKRV
jgi:hypothetical protein